MITRVYRYGIRPPTEGAKRIREQIKFAHLYYNELLEIYRIERDGLRSAYEGFGLRAVLDAQLDVEKELAEALDDMMKARSKTRNRSESPDQKARVAEARKARKKADGVYRKAMIIFRKDAKGLLFEDVTSHAFLDGDAGARSDDAKNARKRAVHIFREAFARARKESKGLLYRDILHAAFLEAFRSARGNSELFWGTYLTVEASVTQANSDKKIYRYGSPQDPRRRRWTGEGRVGIQIQSPVTLLSEEAMDGNDTRLRIETVPDRLGRTGITWANLWMRIGSKGPGNRVPIWGKWPAKLHRPLPIGAQIRWAHVSLRKIGPREVWTVELTMRTEAEDTCGNGTVAIDIGWRKIGSEIRVACWVDDDGNRGEIRLDKDVISGLTLPDGLRSIRDRNRDEVLAYLIPMLDAFELPEWFCRRTARKEERLPTQPQTLAVLAQWKSSARLADLVKTWKGQRWDGDEEAYCLLEAWRYHDFHLWEWETNQRAQSIGHRLDIYRNIVSEMVDQYSVFVIEDFKISDVAVTRPPEEDATIDSNSIRKLAAVSTLVLTIKSTSSIRSAGVVEVDCRNSTRECPECGFTEAWDAAASINRRPPCPECGSTHDQDYGAARVLLARYTKSKKSNGGNGVATPAKEKKDPKWVRVAKAKKEKKARMTGPSKT